MIDFAKITVKAGNGGSGAGSFRHIKGKRYGKADGGNGGRGGHVYFETSGDLNTLEPYRFVKNFDAEYGGSGSSNLRRGAGGRDLVLKVPIGTQITINGLDGEVYDMVDDNQKVLVARGGEGGRGNAHLRDEFGRRPRVAEVGKPGDEVAVTLELKLIADVGIIGLPNAGKSTLLAALTAARPKIAEYPFTTLEPNLGVLKPTSTPAHQPKSLILADIPGLIEGANQGKGLGDKFLRHIERTRVLLHVIDISPPNDVTYLYETVRNELHQYGLGLSRKREIIILNKIDLVDSKRIKEAKSYFSRRRKRVFSTSAHTGQGIEELKAFLLKITSP